MFTPASNSSGFFDRTSVEVAPELLGARLTRHSALGHITVRITEVEAYLGVGEDPGSHSFRGQTPRNAVMFGPPLHLYTYFTYGMHVCANIVCSPQGQSSAVLLRAGEVVEGVEQARANRGEHVALRDLARGPARLTKAMAIPLSDGGASMVGDVYSLELSDDVQDVGTSVRTGVSGPGGSAAYPWRFFLVGDPTVSPYRASAPRKRD
ncbi:DNA-3-methyladenine glycosylase [Agreia bicolorata]|uniref:Putative 3-methyladenine DNA glycosylase n=1 Tax=Agreia bicolorata TaxID=110935 RepID=A0ABR5CCW6_9MICO|nr:DNA-3-methyladenine glycosylase [Agreia bicolorata]KJC63480.1 DNA-3-methyladenine glycosidase [Agreia bicolorata]